MKRKNISSNVKKRLLFILPITMVCIAIFTISICTHAYKIYSLKREQVELQERLDALKDKADDLNDEINKLKDPDYIAKYARENYYYTKNGEYVIKVNEFGETGNVSIQTDTNRAYYVISLVLLTLIVLVFILKKKSKKKIMEY